MRAKKVRPIELFPCCPRRRRKLPTVKPANSFNSKMITRKWIFCRFSFEIIRGVVHSKKSEKSEKIQKIPKKINKNCTKNPIYWAIICLNRFCIFKILVRSKKKSEKNEKKSAKIGKKSKKSANIFFFKYKNSNDFFWWFKIRTPYLGVNSPSKKTCQIEMRAKKCWPIGSLRLLPAQREVGERSSVSSSSPYFERPIYF